MTVSVGAVDAHWKYASGLTMDRYLIKKLFVVLIILLSGHGSFATTTVKTVFTLYTTPATWNTAKNVCWRNGGRLASVHKSIVTNVLQSFGNNEWENQDNPYWIGLFQPPGESIPNTWSGQCEVATGYTNWGEGDFNADDRGSCSSADFNTGKWSRKTCDETLNFVCESWEGHCYYLKEEGVYLRTDSNRYSTTILVGYARSDLCVERCSNPTTSEKECWAAAYSTDSKLCLLYYSDSPDTVAGSALELPSENTALYRRVCFVGRLNHDAIPDELKSDSQTVFRPCFQYDDPVELATSSSVSENTRPVTPSPENMSTRPSDPASPVTSLPADGVNSVSSSSAGPVSPSPAGYETPASSSFDPVSYVSSPPSGDETPMPSSANPHPSVSSLPTNGVRSGLSSSGSNSPATRPVDQVTPFTEPLSTTIVKSSTDMRLTLSPTAGRSTCFCPCSTPMKLSDEESSEFMSSIIQDIKIVKTNTSSYKRKHVSIVEDRPSVNAIGYLGAVLMGLTFGGLLLLDLPVLYRDIGKLLKLVRPTQY